jgi:hemerythrin
MSKKIDTSEQFIEFYKKKAENLVSLADNHYLNKEYRKCLELLNQAYSMYQKGHYNEEAEKIKQRFNEVKEMHFKKKE